MNTLEVAQAVFALGLDLYLWLTYRTFTLRAPQRLTWRQLYHQFGAAPRTRPDDNEHGSETSAVKDCLRELKKIKLAWPELNYTTAPGVLILHPSTPSDRAAQSRPARKLISPFPDSLSRGLSASEVGLLKSPKISICA